ncbi:unnamed protein product [Paramecium pentaurelia]|uniref:Uncharacterized protein n=1 Tax=Paramecium pentaurelia TaxID=43138 RepID=A0A8S1T6J4_9CILI|nr:unnamed protein product [Paramecium pentaurelia]
MNDLFKEIDDTNSDTSIIDFNFESDDEEIIDKNDQPIQVIQDQVEIVNQEEQIILEKGSSIQGQQNCQEQNTFEQQGEQNVISLPVQHDHLKPKLIKYKKHRECNLQQGYQILKTFGYFAHTSYKNVQQKKEQAFQKITNYIISGVEKIKRL